MKAAKKKGGLGNLTRLLPAPPFLELKATSHFIWWYAMLSLKNPSEIHSHSMTSGVGFQKTAWMTYVHHNSLLSTYMPEVHRDFTAQLELVHLKQGQILYDSGQKISHAYFPATAVLSLMVLMEDGATIEIASVGGEGFVGLPLIFGGDAMSSRVEVCSPGFAYKMRAADLLYQASVSSSLKQAVLLYAQTLMTFMSQSSACHRHHSVLPQLCRWLLQTMDRTHSDHLAITQQSIANMLGVRREGVTEAMGKLEKSGIVRHVRGHVTVSNRQALEDACCECYGVLSSKIFSRFCNDASLNRATSTRTATTATSY